MDDRPPLPGNLDDDPARLAAALSWWAEAARQSTEQALKHAERAHRYARITLIAAIFALACAITLLLRQIL